MIYKTIKSTSSGYRTPEVSVVEVLPEGLLAASLDTGAHTINDMHEWSGWEE
ncbi:MAG: hypothetical protein IJ314_03165 [Bacteroidales bacterium]|nr:hypothetical protein [Bacteroidales bacterium]